MREIQNLKDPNHHLVSQSPLQMSGFQKLPKSPEGQLTERQQQPILQFEEG
jgi:hypothetical protein